MQQHCHRHGDEAQKDRRHPCPEGCVGVAPWPTLVNPSAAMMDVPVMPNMERIQILCRATSIGPIPQSFANVDLRDGRYPKRSATAEKMAIMTVRRTPRAYGVPGNSFEGDGTIHSPTAVARMELSLKAYRADLMRR